VRTTDMIMHAGKQTGCDRHPHNTRSDPPSCSTPASPRSRPAGHSTIGKPSVHGPACLGWVIP